MIRVLQCVNIMDRAGLENMLMNYYRNIDRDVIQFDFLTHRSEKGAYDDEIEQLGGKVYHAPRLYPQNYIRYFKWMKKFFSDHPEYKIVHSHIDAMSYFPLLAAKKAGIPVRIAHSHNSRLDRDFKLPIKYIALKLIPKVSNYRFACGEMAGKFMFGNREFKIINNAIDIKKFSFDESMRARKREELGIQTKFVIGHVGRYCHVKNQLFLLEVLKKIKNANADAYLLLVGKGEDEQKIKDKISFLHLEDSVLMLTDRSDVDQLYQAMDVFVLPSLFEGLPVVGVEAQANGLPCIFSDNISKEIILSNSASMLDIDINKWVNKILNIELPRNEKATVQLKKNGYDICEETEKIKSIYERLISGETI